MEKETLKKFFEEIENYLEKNDYASFSSWGSSINDDYFLESVQEIFSKGKQFVYNEQMYLIAFSAATNGKGGMDEGSPDTWTVTKVVEEEVFNANDFLERNTFRILDWKTGTKRVQKLGYDTTLDYELNDLFEIAETIFDRGYDIQIVTYDSGNVILMIDDKKFKHS